MKAFGGRVIAYPLSGIAYNECFYRAVADCGAPILEGVWAGRWILANVRRGDVVHIHWPSFYYRSSSDGHGTLVPLVKFAAFLAFMKLRGASIVWTAHNLYPHDGGRQDRVHRIARWLIVRFADVVLAHGNEAAAIVKREFGIRPDKLHTIEHGNWIDYYPATIDRAEARKRLGIPANAFVFGFVGLCKPYKNVHGFIEAFGALRTEANLLIAGHFQSPEYLQNIRGLLGAVDPARVVFHPKFLRNDELEVYVQAADVIVLPFTEILTSGSAMLALSFGRPVVAPDLGALREIVGSSCGILYEPGDPARLAEAMRSARERQFDERQIRDHARSFSWQRAAQGLLSALGRGVDPKRPAESP